MKHIDIPAIQQLIELSMKSKNPLPEQWQEDAFYYRFLYFLTQATQPSLVVELGTLHGHSTAHLAAGWRAAKVISIDLNPPMLRPPFSNIEFWRGNSLEKWEKVAGFGLPIDILFIDTIHEAAHATKEFNLYWPLMRAGSILLADDIYLADMRNFWDNVPEPKILNDQLHGKDLGFGVAIKA